MKYRFLGAAWRSVSPMSVASRYVTRPLFLLILIFTGMMVIQSGIEAQGTDPNALPAPVQTYFIPLPEDDLLIGMDKLNSDINSPTHTVVSIVIGADNLIVYYDHWEDNYEIDISKPRQSGSMIWGDGRPGNGHPPGFPDDILKAGDVIVLENDIIVPRDREQFAFDGKDRFSSTDPIAVTRAAWPLFDPGSKASGAVEVYDTNRFGTRFIAPVGVNTESDEMFEYVALMIMAKDDNTVVSVDQNADGVFDDEVTLNRGENYLAEDVMAGGLVESSEPVQVHMITGDIDATYETRSFTLFATERWSSNYFSPVGTTNPDDGPANIFLFNPHSDVLTVNWFTAEGEQPELTVPPKGTHRLLLESSSGTKFSSADERPFYALATVDSNPGSNEIYDWGFTLVPEQVLSTASLVGWGPGNLDTPCTLGSNPEEHAPASPLWVMPTIDAELHVDFDGDPSTGELVDVNGNRFDLLLELSGLESVQLFDDDDLNGDFDQTSTVVYVTDPSARLAVAWGQDPALGQRGSLCNLDLGTGILPLPNFLAAKSVEVSEERIPDGIANAGETLYYEVTISQFGPTLVPDIKIFDEIPEHTSYVPGSAAARGSIDGLTISDDEDGTPFPLDEDGLILGDLPVRGEVIISFEVMIDRPLAKGVETIFNQAIVSALGQESVPEVSIEVIALPDLVIEKGDDDALAIPGETTAYTLTYWNEGGRNAENVVISEIVPNNTTFNPVDSTTGWSCMPDNDAGSLCTLGIELLEVSDTAETAVFAITTNPDLPRGVTHINNRATITDDGTNGADRFPNNNEAEDSSPVPDFSAEKTAELINDADEDGQADPGDTLRYAIIITQIGDAYVPDVTIFDELPANTSYVPGSTMLNGDPLSDDGEDSPFPLDAAGGIVLGEIPVGESFTVTFDVTIAMPLAAGVELVANEATVSAAGKEATPQVETAVDATPDLTIHKSDGDASAIPGRDLIYTLTYANVGNQNATAVTIRESVPGGALFNPTASTPGWACEGNSCTFAIEELVANGVEASVEFAVTVNETLPEAVLQLDNSVTIRDDGRNGADPTPENNEASESSPVPQYRTSKTATVVNDENGNGKADAGETLRYEITITQMGEAPVPDVRVSDIVPEYTSYVPGSTQLFIPEATNLPDTANDGFPLSANGGVEIGEIPVGGAFRVTYEMKLDDVVPAGAERIINEAVVTSPGKEQRPFVETPLMAEPDLTISIDDGDVQSEVGETIIYEVTYDNIGNQDATGVAASVVITDYVSFNAEASTPGWGCVAERCTFPVSELPVGSDMGVVLFAVTVDQELPDGMGVLVEAVAEIGDDGSNGDDPTPENNQDEDDTPVPRFRTDKSYTVVDDEDGDGQADPGDTVAYTILISQIGAVPATDLHVYDTIPELTSYVEGSTTVAGEPVADDGEGTPFPLDGEPDGMTLDDIPVGGAVEVTFHVIIDAPFPAGATEVSNVARVHSYGQEEMPSVVTPVDATPDLVISKDDGGASAVPGDDVVYTITYRNAGDQNATAVLIREQLPTHTTINASASTSGWACAGAICTFDVGELVADGAENELIFVVRVDETIPSSVARIDNTTSIADDGSNGPDPTPANNEASDYSPVPQFTAVKTATVIDDIDGDNEADAGETIQYEITITQVGEAPVPDVRVSDIVPEFTSYVPNSTKLLTPDEEAIPDPSEGEFPLTVPGGHPIGEIPVGGVYIVVYQMKVDDVVPSGYETVKNAASVSSPGKEETTAVETPLQAQPDLTIDIDDDDVQSIAGETVVYEVGYSNQGNQQATNVVATATIVDYASFNAEASTPGWSCEGATCTFSWEQLDGNTPRETIDFAVTVAETLPDGMGVLVKVDAAINDDGSNGEDPNLANNQDADNTPVPRFQAIKEVTVAEDRDGDGQASAGDILEYVVTITQLGEVPVTDLSISDTIPEHTSYVSDSTMVSGEAAADSGGGFPLAGTNGLALADIPVGGATQVRFLVEVANPLPAGISTVTNVATVRSFGQEEMPEVSNRVFAAPDLSVDKDDAGASAVPGRGITYTLTFSNTGTQDATGVTLVEQLPNNSSFDASNSSSGWSCDGRTCRFTVGDLPADGESQSVTYAIVVNPELDESVITLENNVRIEDDAANGADPTPENNLDSETSPVPHFTAEKSVILSDDVDGDGLADPGDSVQYEITITQIGDAPVPDVTVSDIVPAFTSYVAGSTSLEGEAIADSADGLPLTDAEGHLIGDVAVGSSVTVRFQVTLDERFPSDIEEIVNNAFVRSPGREVAAQVSLFVDAEPDLKVQISDDGVQSMVGGLVLYEVAYSNVGVQDATGTAVSVTFNGFVSIDESASDSGWSCDGNVCTFSVGELETSAESTLILGMRVDEQLPDGAGVMIEAVAAINDDGRNGEDKNPTNNTDEEETPVPRFTAVKSSTVVDDQNGNGQADPGDIVEYVITIAQHGAVAVPEVRLADTLPELTRYVDGSAMIGDTAVSGNFPFDVEDGVLIGDVEVGASVEVRFQVEVDDPLPATITELYNQAIVTTFGQEEQPDVTTPITAQPDLILEKDDNEQSAVPGETIVYELTYRNNGSQDATGVILSETVPANSMFDAANSDAGWSCVDSAAGSSCILELGNVAANNRRQTVEFAVLIDPSLPETVMQVENSASIADDGSNGADPTPENNIASDVSFVPRYTAVKEAILSNDVDGDGRFDIGDTVEYRITITQMGGAPLEYVTLFDTLPMHTSYISGSAQLLNPDATPLNGSEGEALPLDVEGGYALPTIPVGGSLTVIFQAEIQVCFVDRIFNEAIVDDGIVRTSIRADVWLDTGPDLVLWADEVDETAVAGGTLGYTYTYFNVGNNDATGVMLTIPVPKYTSFNPNLSSPGWECAVDGTGQTICAFAVGDVATGADAQTISFGLTISGSIPESVTEIYTRAVIDDDGTNGVDPSPGNNVAD